VLAFAACGDDESPEAEGVPPTFFGMQPQEPLTAEDYSRMAEGNVGSIRMFVPWGLIDPTEAGGDYEWGPYDDEVLGAAREGIDILPFLFGSPTWVSQGLDGNKCETDCDRYAPRSDEALRAWRDFVAAAVDRYGPQGSLWADHPDITARPIRTWQIWNEQNSPTFYLPAPDPDGYAKLLDAASEEIRTRDPGAQVLIGGMFETPLGGEPPAYLASEFLHRLYEIEGPDGSFTGVASHPYAAHLEKVELQVELLYDEILAAGDADATLWITELGWASDGPEDAPLVRGLEGQAESLTEAYTYFLDRREEWNVQAIYWYSWHDTETQICDWCPGSGLFEAGEPLEPKPAWEAFTSFTGGS
jgi:hypothetical protein